MSEIKGLYKDYEDFKVDVPYWNLSDTGITVLWGPSGSGKSSVLRLLIGLEECPSLSWNFKGENLSRLPVPERHLGVVFQSYDLFPHMSGKENISFALEARGLSFAKVQDDWKRLHQKLKLENYWERKASVLSGGERQRLALARALITRPRFLLLDEPFSNLDTALKQEARFVLKELVKEFGIPALLVTHDPLDLEELADQVVYIQAGKLKEKSE